MPSYDLKNNETGEIKNFLVSISKKEEMVATGEWTQVHLGAAATVTHTGNIINRTSGDWQNHLQNIKKAASKSRRHGHLADRIKT